MSIILNVPQYRTWQLVRSGFVASHFLSLQEGNVMNAGMSDPTCIQYKTQQRISNTKCNKAK